MDYLRKPKILDMSIFDWVTALIGGYLIAYFLNYRDIKSILLIEVGFILFGILIHKLFGIDTMLGYYLGINKKPIRK
jgi:hypothetical protein